MSIIEDYLTYLKVERKLCSSTISNHAASLMYCVKYLHREFSPEYTDMAIIRRLRGQVATFQRQARGETASTKEDLEEQNRWLDWEEIVSCVSLQRERVDMARSGLARALECADVLLLSLYILIPPSRGQEVRTLEKAPSTLTLTRPELAGRNLVHLEEDGGATFRFQDYKTVKSYGVDTTSLQKEHQLSLLLKEYLEHHRPKLATASESKDFLLLNRLGKPFSGPGFCGHLKSLFYRLTGVHVSVIVLRSSFLTHAYDQRKDCIPRRPCSTLESVIAPYSTQKEFKEKKETLVKELFQLYNETVFENKFPSDFGITWSNKMRSTAGFCFYERKNGVLTARIQLADKVVDSADRLRDTLIHEMCHAVTWLINGVRAGHGPIWKNWTRRANHIHKDLPPISRCHSYKINAKYNYQCSNEFCSNSIGRHSKLLDLDKYICAYCHSRFKLQP